MTGSHYKLDQDVGPAVAAAPDVASLLREVNKGSRRWSVATNLVNAFFFIPCSEGQKIDILATQRCTINVNSPPLSNNTAPRGLDQLTCYHLGSHTDSTVLYELGQ